MSRLPETADAVLWCSIENRPKRHRFHHREKSSLISTTDALIFNCESCGASRVWGNENAKWERVDVH